MPTERVVDVPVRGGNLRVVCWGDGPPVYAAHGITASHQMWRAVAAQLGDEVTLIAPDLRGRGESATLPGPWGMATHVEDAIATLDHLGIDRATIVGGSMGGYVAVLLAAGHPDRVSAVGLCDGGVALPVPEGVDPEEMLRATLGPSIERLEQTFADVDAYVDFWREHPALKEDWNDDIEAFVRYDAVASGDAVRSKVDKDAIMADGRDLLTNDAISSSIADIDCPVWLLRAPRGLLNQPAPLISDDLLALWKGDHLPQLTDEMVDDLNHFTLFLVERGAKEIADRIRTSV